MIGQENNDSNFNKQWTCEGIMEFLHLIVNINVCTLNCNANHHGISTNSNYYK
jgi:hypothetical protein